MNAWNACEGNANGQSGIPINNPFNTTLTCCGGTPVNSAGVKRYPTWQAGLQATVQTLQAGRYTAILTNLRNDGTGSVFAGAVGTSGWGTSGSCIAKSLGTTQAPQPTGGGTGNAPGAVSYTYAQLEYVWIQAGGSQQMAAMAAAIAFAESLGVSTFTREESTGSVDRGLWGINSGHGDAQSTYDVMGNARAAVAISGNGQSWRAWCTAYVNGDCRTCYVPGGGCQGMAPYQRYLNPNIPPDSSAPINPTNGVTNPTSGDGGSSGTGTGQDAQLDSVIGSLCSITGNLFGGICYLPKSIQNIFATIFENIFNPLLQISAGVGGMLAGGVLVVMGLFVMFEGTSLGQRASGTALGAFAPEAATVQAARIRAGAGQQAETGRQVRQVRGQQFSAAQAKERQGTVRVTTSTTTGPPGDRRTVRTTRQYGPKDQLNDEARGYR